MLLSPVQAPGSALPSPREGYRVTGLSRGRPPLEHAQFSHGAVDLLDSVAMDAALGSMVPHALVHAAGLMRAGSLGSLELAEGEMLWQLHVDIATRLANALAPRMAEGGRIIFIGSRMAPRPLPACLPLAATSSQARWRPWWPSCWGRRPAPLLARTS